MLISVRTIDGKEIKLEVQPTDTILTVKTEIQNKESIRADLQRLVFGENSLENSRSLSSYKIGEGSILHLILKAAENSNIVAGGFGRGTDTKAFGFPYGLVIDDNRAVIVTDWGNHRIVQWGLNDVNGRVIAGGQGQGSQLNQLNCPTDVLIDKVTDSLIICDRGNRRVVRWSRHDGTTQGEVLLNNIACWGLAMDNQGDLYISDVEKHEVRRYKAGDKNGTVVAGGHGRGAGLNQLNEPNYIFVDEQQNVYVSDTWNNRVMKWKKGEENGNGTIVVRGFPRGLFVDKEETIYVADYGNHQLTRWPKGATKGIDIASGLVEGDESNKLYCPWGLSFDKQNDQLFVSDHSNHRVQRFSLK